MYYLANARGNPYPVEEWFLNTISYKIRVNAENLGLDIG